jgi:hypothetical protein
VPLLGREGSCGRTYSGHPTLVSASSEQEARMNVRHRLDLNQVEQEIREEYRGRRLDGLSDQAPLRDGQLGGSARRQSVEQYKIVKRA